MRVWSLFALAFLAGCQSISLGIGPSAPPTGGGGGGVVSSAESGCPADAAQAMDTAIASVSDPVAQGSLLQQWRYMQTLSGSANESALEDVLRWFTGTCANLASQGFLSQPQADEMTRLAHCYLGL